MNERDEHHEHQNHGRRKSVRASASLYRRLLLVYPRSFREEYAEEMSHYFAELCEDALQSGGILALIAVWIRTLLELILSARTERLRSAPDKEVEATSAAALSLLLLPGSGQAYNFQVVKALLHSVLIPFTLLFSSFFLPAYLTGGQWVGLVFVAWWLYSGVDAWVTARRIQALRRLA